ncbi:MAG: DUF1934 domain-containing protein [Oscillospiraceae bacterium]
MKDYIISIKGLQGTTDDGEDIELVTDGTFATGGGKTAFAYMESELTGMDGTLTEFSVEDGSVIITRSGTINMQMTFIEGQKHYFVYETPYGSMTMGVDTQSIRAAFDDNGGELEVRYLMDLGNSMVTRNCFKIHVKKA